MPTYVRKFYIHKHNESVKMEQEKFELEAMKLKNKQNG